MFDKFNSSDFFKKSKLNSFNSKNNFLFSSSIIYFGLDFISSKIFEIYSAISLG